MTRSLPPKPFARRGLKPALLAYLMLLPVFLGMTASLAQGTSVEELERRLQKAKEEKARREAAATRAGAERRALESRQANLVVQTDAPCTLFVNGKQTAQLSQGITEVRVSPGQKLVSCTSSEEETAFEGELDARSGQDTVLRIVLAGKVAAIRSARAAVLEREAQARQEAEKIERAEAARRACGGSSTMQATSNATVLRQCLTDLQWTRSDNGQILDWREAHSHCRGLGDGWSLPTVEQLESLINRALPGVRCDKTTCKVSDQFQLSGWSFWTSTRAPRAFPSEFWFVILDDGFKFHLPRSQRNDGMRALCVRSP